jgi:hypothetical protein
MGSPSASQCNPRSSSNSAHHLFRDSKQYDATHHQLNDFWSKDIPFYLPVASIKACRLVCRRWADVYRLPNVTMDFLSDLEESSIEDIPIHLAQTLRIDDFVPIQRKLFRNILSNWKSNHYVLPITTLCTSELQINDKAASRFARLIKMCPNLTDCSLCFYGEPQYGCCGPMIEALAAGGTIQKLSVQLLDVAAINMLNTSAERFSKLYSLSIEYLCPELTPLDILLSSLGRMSSISSLALNVKKPTEDNIAKIVSLLDVSTSLTSLDLQVHRAPQKAGVQLAKAARRSNRLLRLALSGISILDAPFISKLGSYVRKSSNLESLKLAADTGSAGPLSLDDLFNALKRQKSLRSLEIRGNGSHQTLSIAALGASLASNTNLTSLSLELLDPISLAPLWESLAFSNTTLREMELRELTLPWDDPKSFGMCEFALMAACNRTLHLLELSSITVPDSCFRNFFSALQRNEQSAITDLNFGNCSLEKNCLPALKELLESQNCKIRKLSLNDTFYGGSSPSSMASVYKALEKNSSVVSLHADCLESSEAEDYSALVDALQKNETLLLFTDERISWSEKLELLESVQSRVNKFGLIVQKRLPKL